MAGPFPVANRPNGYHRRLGALLLASVTAMALSSPIASADDLKNKHKQVEQQVDHAEHELETSSATAAAAKAAYRKSVAQLRTAQTQLQATQAALAAAAARDAEMQAALNAALQNLATARQQLAEGKRQVELQKENIADLVTKIYEQGDPRLLGFVAVAEAGDPGDMTRAIAFNEAYGNQQDKVLDGLEAAERALAAQEVQVAQRKDEVEQGRAAAAANLAEKDRLTSLAAAQTAEVQKLVDQRAAVRMETVRARAADRAALKKLQQEEAAITEMLRRRAQEALKNGAPGVADGYLSAPINPPRITSSYGWRTHPIYGDRRLHNGVDFGAGCGQSMFAPADGVVVARGGGDWDPSGNYLFIDHGGVAGVGLSTSYSHAIRYIVSVGQHVKRGQVIGYVGSTGWSTGCHLHWTVKENGVNVDPMKWL